MKTLTADREWFEKILPCKSACGDQTSFCAFLCLLWLFLSEVFIQTLSLHILAAESVDVIQLPGAILEKKNERRGPLIAGIVCFWSPFVKHVDHSSFAVSPGRDNRVTRRLIPRSDERIVAR